jgi:hypothetical protein
MVTKVDILIRLDYSYHFSMHMLTTWEAEIGRIMIQGQPGQIVHESSSPKYPEQNGLEVWLNWWAGCLL